MTDADRLSSLLGALQALEQQWRKEAIHQYARHDQSPSERLLFARGVAFENCADDLAALVRRGGPEAPQETEEDVSRVDGSAQLVEQRATATTD